MLCLTSILINSKYTKISAAMNVHCFFILIQIQSNSWGENITRTENQNLTEIKNYLGKYKYELIFRVFEIFGSCIVLTPKYSFP